MIFPKFVILKSGGGVDEISGEKRMKDYLWKVSMGCVLAFLISYLIFCIKNIMDFLKDMLLNRMPMYPFY